MKKFFLCLILALSFQSLVKAEDISDFEIEGMSINKSILDYMSVNEVLDNTLPYFDTKRKYFVTGIVSNLKLYDQVEIYLKSNDKKYTIKSIVAGLFIDDLDQIFSNIQKMSGSKKHEADPTGKSIHYIDQYNLGYPNHIRVECTQFSDDMINSGMAQNSLNVVVMTKEINDWIASGYK